jgi:hypothetical protein
VGADRKGPLAAFIVIAIIAAILLITSVRSQAAAGWLGRSLPTTPQMVHTLDGGLDRAVRQGSVLVHRSAGLVAPARSRDVTAPATHDPARNPAHDPARAKSPNPASTEPVAPTATAEPTRQPTRDGTTDQRSPGRHLGWTHSAPSPAAQGRRERGRHLGRRGHGRREPGDRA